ncbi:unnamed protein product [Linum trigynum]|uniref:Uncharacterized protein n=1 Tax=Linum trigynum TaxID=586398 RepID=A0AAV2DZC6_9ROSI
MASTHFFHHTDDHRNPRRQIEHHHHQFTYIHIQYSDEDYDETCDNNTNTIKCQRHDERPSATELSGSDDNIKRHRYQHAAMGNFIKNKNHSPIAPHG